MDRTVHRLDLSEDRFFDPDPSQRAVARQIYAAISPLPIVSPHGHVSPRLFASDSVTFGTPADFLIIPDHYVFRMLYSQGISLESLGVPRLDGGEVEQDHRKIWQIFAENFYLFRGTPSGVWLAHELHDVFGVEHKLDGSTAQEIYDQIAACLEEPEFKPRALFERFNIEVLCTTDSADDMLEYHQAIRRSDWKGNIRPTFRSDSVTHLLEPGWGKAIQALGAASGIDIFSFDTFIQALEQRRSYFKSLGATATDHAVETAFTGALAPSEAEAIFQRALHGTATPEDDLRFSGHMLMEMARMSIEDGLVMQLHCGAYRDHNRWIFERFGPNMGADMPIPGEFTRNLSSLLNRYGIDPRLTLILFTLDEATYSRELAPLAGHYPALKLGPPWWFFDSPIGMQRYFDQVVETAGLYNLSGFNDDTRAFPSIPARHDLWRRVSANWLAGLVVRGVVDEEDAHEMALDLAYRLARRAYRLET
ncbi:MAG: glucuronate isomerase [Chloroflexota bacterium]|nr:MAG: glucuronate isomerase [Chloroflexota bacterium]